jgi:hypothetical protein
MLNKDNVRELAYVVKIDEIRPIAGRDRVECAAVGGWTIMVRKGQFQPGDLGIYFEIDSQVPAKEPFMFLEAKHFKIKTQKYKTPDGQFWSQGLLMSADDFGWTLYTDGDGTQYIHDPKNNQSMPEGTFLTEKLGITYAVAEDNARKANSADKYKKMAQRNNKLFAHQPLRWLMRRDWGKKLLFVFFGRKRDRKASWPIWVSKTDEERVQNMPWILQNKEPWVATEKIDGSSTTFTMKRGKRRKNEFFVCSRNVVFDKPEKPCYYDTNIYLEMAEKYHVEEVLNKILLEHPEYDWVTIQGETYGDGVQKRDYSLGRIAKDSDGKISGHDFMAFNFITSDKGRWNSLEGKEFLNKYGIPWVPIVDSNFILPDTIEELLSIATGDSVVDGGMREGLVFRSQDGAQSFKAVSNEFLLRFHS